MNLSTWQWIALGGSGVLIGLQKTGLSGSSMLVIPIMVAAFGARASVGLVLPLLIVGDVIGVSFYHRFAERRVILQILPWALVGVTLGAVVGHLVSDITFRRLIAAVLIVGIGFTGFREFFKRDVVLPHTWVTTAALGVVAGFSSMVGNAAVIATLYFLAVGLRKNELIGTLSWLFFIVNLSKVPFHWFMWHTITVETLRIDLIAVLPIAVGAVVGLFVVRAIPERPYRMFVLVTVSAAAARLMFG